jgi:predicted DNA-binding antitoxin AbrB/MazE fold protein
MITVLRKQTEKTFHTEKPAELLLFLNVNLGEGEKIKVKSRKNKQHFSVLKAVTDMAVKKRILAGIIRTWIAHTAGKEATN